MSKSWNKEELKAASEAMKKAGQMSYEEFCEALAQNEYWTFLEKLRQSGKTNMFGAAPYLAKEFDLTMVEAHTILVDWMKNYNREDYE